MRQIISILILIAAFGCTSLVANAYPWSARVILTIASAYIGVIVATFGIMIPWFLKNEPLRKWAFDSKITRNDPNRHIFRIATILIPVLSVYIPNTFGVITHYPLIEGAILSFVMAFALTVGLLPYSKKFLVAQYEKVIQELK